MVEANSGSGPLEPPLVDLAERIAASPHNLVSRRAREELLDRHVPECRSFARLLPETGQLLDIGSGGGLPGLVIAILRPRLEVHLVEATAKKVGFLREVAGELAPGVVVHHGRAEELARGPMRHAFPTVTARAVAPLQRLVVWSEPFLHPDGLLWAIKGERWAEEVAEATGRLERLGLEVVGDPGVHPQLAPSPDDPHRPRVVMIGRRA